MKLFKIIHFKIFDILIDYGTYKVIVCKDNMIYYIRNNVNDIYKII